MQLNTFSTVTSTLAFDDVVPKQTSTPHVAAAAFYHCLGMSVRVHSRSLSHVGAVLATKDLVQVAQETPYGTLRITVK